MKNSEYMLQISIIISALILAGAWIYASEKNPNNALKTKTPVNTEQTIKSQRQQNSCGL